MKNRTEFYRKIDSKIFINKKQSSKHTEIQTFSSWISSPLQTPNFFENIRDQSISSNNLKINS